MNQPENKRSKSISFLSNRVGRLMGKNLREKFINKGYDITSHFMGILSDLWIKDGIKQQDLVISIIKDKATITRSLDAMEEQDILVRIPSKEDKRKKLIFLTTKGKALKHKLFPLMQSVEKEAIKGVSKEEMAICIKVLNKVYKNLNV